MCYTGRSGAGLANRRNLGQKLESSPDRAASPGATCYANTNVLRLLSLRPPHPALSPNVGGGGSVRGVEKPLEVRQAPESRTSWAFKDLDSPVEPGNDEDWIPRSGRGKREIRSLYPAIVFHND
jgi:hypothetical protein